MGSLKWWRRWLLFPFFGACLALVVTCFWLWFGPNINLAQYSRIRPGMGYREVDVLLGGDGEDPAGDGWVTWYDHPEGLTIVVEFDDKGVATNKFLVLPEPFRTLRRRILGY